MGNTTNVVVAYSKVVTLLYFKVVEATYLPLQPPLLLSLMAKHHMCCYVDVIIAREHQCIITPIATSHQPIMAKS
jgi:hypothetical protein